MISPLRVETDHNNVNIVSGKTTIEPPVAFRAGRAESALRPRPERRALCARHGHRPGRDDADVNWSVHTGSGSSESFGCVRLAGLHQRHRDRLDLQGIGGRQCERRLPAGRDRARSGTSTGSAARRASVRQAYASRVTYPNGEVISYTYDSAARGHRPDALPARPGSTAISGYHITITYQSDDLRRYAAGARRAVATIYNSRRSRRAARPAHLQCRRHDHRSRRPDLYLHRLQQRARHRSSKPRTGHQLPGEAGPRCRSRATASPPARWSARSIRDGVQ